MQNAEILKEADVIGVSYFEMLCTKNDFLWKLKGREFEQWTNEKGSSVNK